MFNPGESINTQFMDLSTEATARCLGSRPRSVRANVSGPESQRLTVAGRFTAYGPVGLMLSRWYCLKLYYIYIQI